MAPRDDPARSFPSFSGAKSDSTDEIHLKSTALFRDSKQHSEGDFLYVTSQTPKLDRLGRYQLLEVLGRGGFGEVWKAFDPDLNCHVAVKFPRPDRVFSSDKVEEFLEEGRKLAKLRGCPGVITVYDVGRYHDLAYIVSELVEGGTLADRLQHSPPALGEAIHLVAQIAEALHSAHLRDLIHRDLKPGNILLRSSGDPVIVDFGLATTEQGQLAEKDCTLGTVAYMSPEQAAGHNRLLTPQTDIYSLGVILFQLLTGRLPYVADSAESYRQQTLHREPRPPRTINDHISPELEQICLKCLARHVTHRYTTAADLAQELRRCLPQTDVRPESSAPKTLAGSPLSRGRVWGVWGMLALASLLLVLGTYNIDKTPRPEIPERPLPHQASALDPQPAPEVPSPRPFQQLPAQEIVPFRWYRLMEVEPVTLSGPQRPGDGKHYDRESESLTIANAGQGMFRLGTVASDSYQIRVEVSQPGEWKGAAGLFLGISDDEETDRSGQLILFLQNTGPDWKEHPLLAVRYLVRMSGEEGFHYTPPQTAVPYSVKLPRTTPGQSVHLEVEVDQGTVSSVRCGHQELPVLLDPELAEAFEGLEVTGQVGVVCWLTNGVRFERPEIRIQTQISPSL